MFEEYSTRLVDKIVTGQEFLSDKFDDIICQLQKLKTELKVLKAENDYLKQSLKVLNEQTNTVSSSLHQQEVQIDTRLRKEISSNAIFLGVPRTSNENTTELVLNVCKTLGLNLDRSEIVSCERITSTVGVAFKNTHQKE